MNYKDSTKDAVKALNPKQTVIVEETIQEGKKTRTVYAGNFKKRAAAYHIGMEGLEKATRKEPVKRSYRLLKLAKLLAEVSVKGYNTKTNYRVAESYSETPIDYTAPAVEAPVAEAPVAEQPAVAEALAE